MLPKNISKGQELMLTELLMAVGWGWINLGWKFGRLLNIRQVVSQLPHECKGSKAKLLFKTEVDVLKRAL